MQATTMQWLLEMFRVPNQWREAGGKFTKDWETPEFKDAVALLRSYWDAGYVHPDTPTFVAQSGAQSFYAGKFGMYPTNFFAFGIAWDRIIGINKDFRLNALLPVGSDGAKAVQYQDWGGNQITVLKKGSAGSHQAGARRARLPGGAVRVAGVPEPLVRRARDGL